MATYQNLLNIVKSNTVIYFDSWFENHDTRKYRPRKKAKVLSHEFDRQ